MRWGNVTWHAQSFDVFHPINCERSASWGEAMLHGMHRALIVFTQSTAKGQHHEVTQCYMACTELWCFSPSQLWSVISGRNVILECRYNDGNWVSEHRIVRSCACLHIESDIYIFFLNWDFYSAMSLHLTASWRFTIKLQINVALLQSQYNYKLNCLY